MSKIPFSEADIEALGYWRFHYPDPRVQVRLEALYLRSQGVANCEILRLWGIAKASFHRYLTAYAAGGIEEVKRIEHYRPQSELHSHRSTLEAAFQQHPPATVAEAAARIEALTGIARKPTQVRQFLGSLGMKPLKVGMLPAKADGAAQETFKKSLAPRLAEAQAGQRVVFFVDAAHFVFAPFLGVLWGGQRLFVKAPSGRQRFNVVAALQATSPELFTVTKLTYSTAPTVCELLHLLAGAYPRLPITAVLDNARYQRWTLGQTLATT